MNRGIIIFSIGHPNYGKMAAMLAASIKVVEDFPVALFWQGKALDQLSEAEKNLFTLIELPENLVYNKTGELNALKARMQVYELTPFDGTLCIDADNIWISKTTPSQIFDSLSSVSFTMENDGVTTTDATADPSFSQWADIQEVIDAYGLQGKQFVKTSGEWIFFKKDDVAKQIFRAAKKVFSQKPRVKTKAWLGQQVPDELAFSVAMAQTEIYPHQLKYHPTSFFLNKKYAALHELAKQCETLSMRGLYVSKDLSDKYNLKARVVYQAMVLSNPYQWISKRSYLPERQKT